MKLQTATRLALYAVMALSREPERQFSTAELADRFDVSEHHLAKVLRTLGRAELVEAVRGAGGGFRFSANPKRVTLLDVIGLFEDITSPVGPKEPGVRTHEGRALGAVLAEIDDVARATLGSITLATLHRSATRR